MLVCFGFFGEWKAEAGTVRSVFTDQTAMAPINLKMGQSTILRFPEKPKKVVLGNSNYYSIEFIDSDIAIQPLGAIATNLFVYGPKNVYGFLLRTQAQGNYDDLVHVKWREQTRQYQAQLKARLLKVHEVSRPGIAISLWKDLSATVSRIQKYDQKNFYLVDVVIENKSKAALKIADFELKATKQKEPLAQQEFILQQNDLKTGESIKARLLVSIPDKQGGFTLSVRLNGLKGSKTILGKYL